MSAVAVNTGKEQAAVPSDFFGQPIWSFPKRGGLIIASEREYKGTAFIDLRLWAAGGEVATRQGVTIPPDAAGDLARALMGHYARTRAREPYKT
jgi:hypothetical protein